MRTILILILLSISLTSCFAGRPKSGPAVVELVDQGEHITNGVSDQKVGQACSVNVLSIVATGDASVETAKRNGGITKVYSIDRNIFGLNIYIPLFAKSCTIIRGV